MLRTFNLGFKLGLRDEDLGFRAWELGFRI